MKFLITGITGFAGPHLANQLIYEKHDVYGLVRHSNGRETDILDVVPVENFNKIKFLYGDLTNSRDINNIFKEHKFDSVFHLAAQSHPPTSFKDPIGTWNTNVNGSLNLIQAIEDHNPEAKLMFCSTSEVYGDTGREGVLIKETDTIFPSNPYGSSKAAIDLYLQERMTNGFIKGFITRAFSHTGPRRGKTFSISSDAFQLAEIYMKHFDNGVYQNSVLNIGNLETVRVVMDVRDTVNAYYQLMMTNNSNGKAFNVCGETPYKMQVYTDKLIAISEIPNVEQKIYEPYYRPIDIAYQHGDISALKAACPLWKPKYTLDQTLEHLFFYWITKLNNNG